MGMQLSKDIRDRIFEGSDPEDVFKSYRQIHSGEVRQLVDFWNNKYQDWLREEAPTDPMVRIGVKK